MTGIGNRVLSSLALFTAVILLLAFPCGAQLQTGMPPFNSFSAGVDTVNLGNLNVHWNFPIVQKSGRGLPFNFSLSFDSSIWRPVSSGSTTSWKPATGFGWTPSNIGRLTFSTSQGPLCPHTGNMHELQFDNFVYFDSSNTPHPMDGTAIDGTQCDVIVTRNGSGSATDGSGYSYNFIVTSDGTHSYTVTDPSGTSVSSTGVIQDRNGNQITSLGSSYVDTLGTTVLTISGAVPNVSYTFTGPSGPSTVTLNYVSYTIRTNFSCSFTQDNEIAYLPDKLTYPDGTFYKFTYESTPGFSGPVTGRLASVRLPTGGTVSYTYGDGVTVGCQNGQPFALTRTTPDGVTQYITGTGGGVPGIAQSTTVTDPAGNVTFIRFMIGNDGGYYETSRVERQGSSTALRTTLTCYNGASFPCDTTAITPPISQVTRRVQLPDSSGVTSQTITIGGLYPTKIDEYDFGSPGSGQPGSLLRETQISYKSFNFTFVKPSLVSIYDGSLNLVAQTTYGYDESGVESTSNTPAHTTIGVSRGNLTSISRSAGSVTLNNSFTYYDTGLVYQARDVNNDPNVNNAQTTYTYGACGNSFPTSVSLPMGLSRSMTWDCSGGVQTSSTDENNNTSHVNYSDAYFWRPSSTQDTAGNLTTLTYTGATQTESLLSFNSGNSVIDQLIALDSLGRPQVSQRRQAPSSSRFDSVQTVYDALGRPSQTSLPYQAASGQASGTKFVVTNFDGAGRPSQTSDAGGGNTTYTYNYNDVLLTAGPAPAGENTKRRQSEYDGLGRLSSVCELTSSSNGGGTCGHNGSQTGYWTKYGYNALNQLTSVTQNAQGVIQTRSYLYDGIGRLKQETNPENGTTYYTYDSDPIGNCAGNYPGDLVKKIDAVGNITCVTYDSLHRILSSKVTPGSPYASVTPQSHFVYDAATLNGTVMQNVKGTLAEAYTCTGSCTSKLTDIFFSISLNTGAGAVTSQMWEATPNSGGYYLSQETYYANGALSNLSASMNGNSIGVPNMSYGLDAQGRLKTATQTGNNLNLASNTTYNVSGSPIQISYGNGDQDFYYYDGNTGRMTGYNFSVKNSCPVAVTGALNWNPIGSLERFVTTDSSDSSKNQSCSYGADDVGRLASVSCGNSWAQTFSYDAFGNVKKDASAGISYLAGYDSSTNHINSGVPSSYDANGNLLTDNGNSYSWTALSQPWMINAISVTYDALGRAVEISSGGGYTQFVYRPSGAKLALMNGTTLVKATIPLPAGSTAVYDSGGFSYFRHVDWLGSSRLATRWDHSTYSKTEYAPFGESYNEAGNMDRSFTGQDQDSASGLYDFMFRRYYPIAGRWISPDPAGISAVDPANPQSWNRYAYVLNNPTNALDPLGLVEDDPWDHFVAGGSYGGGGNCTYNGISIGCGAARGFLSGDSSAICPNGDCAGYGSRWKIDTLGDHYMFNIPSRPTYDPDDGDTENGAIVKDAFWVDLGTVSDWNFAFQSSSIGWWSAFGKSLGKGPSTGTGSCLQVFQDTFTPIVKEVKSQAENSRKYYSPALSSFTQLSLLAEGLIYQSAKFGADRVNAVMIGTGFGVATGLVSRWGAATLAKAPTLAMGAVDLALAYGVYNESKAMMRGGCRY
jgi:RHS repeat-associated protein